MPHTDTTPVSASIASTGPGIRYIGKHIWAASGAIQDAASGAASTEMLNFTSGTGYIMSKLDFTNTVSTNSGDKVFLDLTFNGLTVLAFEQDDAPNEISSPFYILIPPRTHFILKWGVSNVTKDAYAFLTGRVYGEE